ncbi:MAG: isochorismatase family protein [Gammaproteobacteria bacterium]
MTDALEQSYSKAYGGKLEFGARPALLMVDFVKAYFDERCALYADVQPQFESAMRIRKACRAVGVPVFITGVEYEPGGANGGVFYKKAPVLECFDRGSVFGEWPEGLEPQADETVITKQYPSAFFNTGLAERLNTLRVDTVIVTGLTTSGCVRASALDAMCHGFAPFVVSDACGDRHSGPHEANLFDLQAKYAQVVDEVRILSLINAPEGGS